MRGRDILLLSGRVRGLTASAAALFAVAAAARAEEPLTLVKAMESAERNSIVAVAGAMDERLAEQDIRSGLALYMPDIEASFGHVHLDNDPAFKFGDVTFPAGEQLFWKWDLTVRQTIWDFGRRREIVRAAEDSRNAVKARVGNEVRMRQAEVAGIFLEALTVRDQMAVLETRRESLENHFRAAENLYSQGVVTRNELLRTEVAMRSLEDQRRKLESAYASAMDRLAKSMGSEIAPGTPLHDPTSAFSGEVPKLAWNGETLREMALAGNEGLKALDEGIKALEGALSFARKDYYPYLVGSAGHSYEQNRYMAYPHVNRLFLGVSVDLYDGGARKARLAKAGIEVEKARREKLEAEREVSNLVLKAYRDYLDALGEYETARLNAGSSLENLRIVEDQYREGLLRTTDFLEAEALHAESRFKEVESMHRVIALEAGILALVGGDLKRFFAGAE